MIAVRIMLKFCLSSKKLQGGDIINILHKNIGLGSFAFRYAVGIKEFQSPCPMNALAFMEKAYQLGYRRIQLCENLGYKAYPQKDLLSLRDMAKDLGMIIEVGLRKLDEENLIRHIEIALMLGSPFIRAVSHDRDSLSRQEQESVVTAVTKLLKDWAPRLDNHGIRLGLENHFDLATKDLVRIVTEVASPGIGLVFDSTNSLGFLEKPENTLKTMSNFVLSVHLKDYTIQKGEAGYEILGTVLGEGALDISAVFSLLKDRLPHTSIIIESTARRNLLDTPEQVLQWEEEMIQRNTHGIDNLIKKYLCQNKEGNS